MSEFLSLHSASPQALYHVQLVAEELGVNIIKYAYPDQQQHRIKLHVECMPECFRLQILDDGIPFDVRHVPEADPQQNLEDREPGGWGISLARRVSQRIDYERREDMNVLTIEIARK